MNATTTTMGTTPSSAADLLARYVRLHNVGARTKNYRPVVDLFAADAEFFIEGVSLNALRRRAMASAFRREELLLWKIASAGNDYAFANYAWKRRPRVGGILRLLMCDELIQRVTLKPGYSRIFATLAA